MTLVKKYWLAFPPRPTVRSAYRNEEKVPSCLHRKPTKLRNPLPKESMPQPDPLLNDWLTKEQVAEALKVSGKSVERYATQGRVQRRHVPKKGQRPMPLYNPADVERIHGELYGISAFVIPPAPPQPEGGPANTRAMAAAQRAREGIMSQAVAPLAMLAEAFTRKQGDQPGSPARLWMPLADAAKLSGLPRWYLEGAIADGRLVAHDVSHSKSQKRRWRVRRADLETLAIPLATAPAKRMKAAG